MKKVWENYLSKDCDENRPENVRFQTELSKGRETCDTVRASVTVGIINSLLGTTGSDLPMTLI